MTSHNEWTPSEAMPPEFPRALQAMRLLLGLDPTCDRCGSYDQVLLRGEIELRPGAPLLTTRLCAGCRAEAGDLAEGAGGTGL